MGFSFGMPWALPWPFDRTYMQLALLAALVTGACAPLIGAHLVHRNLSLMGDGIAHIAVAGVGAGLLAGVAPFWMALGVATVAAWVLESVRYRTNASGDVLLSVMLYVGLAAGIVMASRANLARRLPEFLFGSILTTSETDVIAMVCIGIGILIFLAVANRALLAIAVDAASAEVAGVPVRGLNTALAIVTSLTVVISMQIIGAVLVSALMVLPVASARMVARSFTGVQRIALAIGMFSAVLGLGIARVAGLAAGGTIVLCAAATIPFALAWRARLPKREIPQRDHHH